MKEMLKDGRFIIRSQSFDLLQEDNKDDYNEPVILIKNNESKMYENKERLFFMSKGIKKCFSEYNDYHQVLLGRVVKMDYGKEYLETIVRDHPAASINHNILGGLPAVKGTRIPLSLLISCFADGMTIEEICQDYSLTPDEVSSSLKFVVDVLNRPFYEG